jgi:DNA-binding beta-propeller fold protein YncE
VRAYDAADKREDAGMNLPPARPTRPGSDINHSLGTTGLVVVCKRDGFVEFHDGKSFALVEEIKLPDFPHEVVLSPDRRKAYVSIYGNGQVGTNTEPGTRIAVLDLAGKKLDGFIEIAPFLAPHGLTFDKNGLLWATAESSHALVYIDPKRGVVLGHVETGSLRTHFVAANADGSKIYVPHRQLSFMTVIDTETRKVTKRIPDFRYECQGVATAPDGNRVYQASSARPEISVIDPGTDSVAGRIVIEGLGEFPPQLNRLRVSPDNRYLVVSFNVSRMAAVVDTEAPERQRLFPLGKGPMGIAFAEDLNHAFVTNHDDGTIAVIDLKAMQIAGSIKTHLGPETMAFY